MRKLRVSELRPGMRVGKPVLSLNGSTLLHRGVELTAAYIESLRAKGVPAIYVCGGDPDAEVDVPDVVDERSRRRAVITVHGVMRALRDDLKRGRPGGRALEDPRIRAAVEDLLNQVLSNREVAVSLSDVRTRDDFHFAHSVQVAILAMLTGNSLGYDAGKLRDLGMGALLHDIGNVKVPLEILNKQGPLTREEFEEEKKHTEYGFEILRRQSDLSLLAAHVAYQHHERYNGEGYPRGLRKDDIHEFARIVAVVDTYDSLTTDRPFRPGYLPHEAAEMLSASGDYLFDYRVVAAFLENVALYPVGALVQLSDGSKGIVTEVTKRLTARPTVRLLLDPEGGRYDPPRDVRLVDHPTLVVSRVFAGPSALATADLAPPKQAALDIHLLRTGSVVAAPGAAAEAAAAPQGPSLTERVRALMEKRKSAPALPPRPNV